MNLSIEDYENGFRKYWNVTESRSSCIQDSEDEFPEFPVIFASRTPHHFTREDLQRIIAWKHNKDARRRTTALEGLVKFPDNRVVDLTRNIGDNIEASLTPFFSRDRFAGEISGVGIATTSAIITAARPDLFAVIDTYALAAIYHHYNFSWLYKISRDADGKLAANWNDYPPYVGFCRAEAAKLMMKHKQPWTPRKIDMALWGIGKQLEENGLL
jgi:hypothetical protein